MSKDSFAQRGWLAFSLDSVMGMRNADQFTHRTKSILRDRPAWVSPKTVSLFETTVQYRLTRLTSKAH